MTDKEKQNLYKECIDKWGADSQRLMCIEEMSELTKELCKSYRPDIKDKTQINKNIIEELADVINMTEQLVYMYGKDEVEKVRNEKLLKTKKMLEDK